MEIFSTIYSLDTDKNVTTVMKTEATIYKYKRENAFLQDNSLQLTYVAREPNIFAIYGSTLH